MAIDVDLRSWDFVPADDDWGDIFAIDLGRWRPELHPRDSHGRFRNSWRLPDAAMAQVERLLRGFNPPPLRSDAHAASYLKGQRGPRSKKQQEALDYFLSRAGNEDIQSTLRGGYDPRRPEPQSARISELDGMMRPLEHDLILSRVLGPDAFGLPPERLGEVEEWTGRRVNDKGFSPMNAGTAYPVSGPHIEMRVLVPKGTKAIIVGSGDPNDPNGRTVILSREQPLRIGKVEKDGKGGFYALATVGPSRGAKGEQPTTGLGRDLPAAQRSPAIEATPDEFQRRGLEPEAPSGPQEQPDRFGPVTPAGPAPVARAAPAAAPPAPTPAPQGPSLEQPSPAKAIREAGGRVPTGAGRVTDESSLNAPEAQAPAPVKRGGRQVIPEPEARLRDREQREVARQKMLDEREARLQKAQEQLLLSREREIQRKDAEIERLQAQREADIAGRTIRADEGTQARLDRTDRQRSDAVLRADERNRQAPGWPANGEDTRIAEHANQIRRERGQPELDIPADAPPATPMTGEIPAPVKRARKVAAKAAPEGAPAAAPAKRVRKAAKAAPEAAPGAPEAAPEAPPAKRVRKVAQKVAPEAAPEAAAPEAPPTKRVRKAAAKAVPEAAPEAAPAAPPVKKTARAAKAAAPEAAVPEGEKDLRGISYEDALKLPPEQWQQRLRQIQDDLKFMKEARKAAPEGAPEAPPAKRAARVVKKAAPEAPEAPPVKKATRGAKKAAPEAAPEVPAKKAAVKRVAKKAAPEAVKAVPEKKVYPERQPKTMKELQDMSDDEIIRYADSLEGPAQNSAEVVAKRMAQAARNRKEEGAPPGETIAERIKRQARPSPEAKPRPQGPAKSAEQIRAENEASKAETRRLEEKAFPERKRPVAKKRGPGKTAEQIRAENEASKAETARLAKKLPAKTPMTQAEREAKEKLPSPTAKKAANKLVKLRAEAFDKNVPEIPGEDGIALRRAQKQLAEGRAVSEVKQDLNDRAEFLRRAAEIEREDPNDLTGRRAVHLDQLADTYERAADMAGKRGPNPDRLTPGDKVERTNKDKSITKGTVAKRGRLTYIDWEDGESQRVLPSRPGRGIKKVGGAEPGVEAPKAAKPATLVELRKEASTLNIPGRSRMDRPQLEEALAARRKKEGESDEEHAARLAKLNERPTVTRAAPRKVAKAREAAPETAPEAPAAAKKAAAKKIAKPSIEDHAANALLEAMPPQARKEILDSMTPDERAQVEEAVQRVKGAAARPTVKRAPRKVARAAEELKTAPLPAHKQTPKAAEKSVAKLVPHGTDGGSIPNKRAPKATGVQAPTKAAKVARPRVKRAAPAKIAEAPPAPETLQNNSKADYLPGGVKHIDLKPLTEGLDFEAGPGAKKGGGAVTVDELAVVPDHRDVVSRAQQELNDGKSPASVARDLRGTAQSLRNVASVRYGGWGDKEVTPGIPRSPEILAEQKKNWTNWFKRAKQFDDLAAKLEATKRPRVVRKAAVAKAIPEVSAPEPPTVTRAARKVAKAAPEAPARLQRSPRLTPEQQNDIADLRPIDKARYRSLRRDHLSHDDALAQTKRERQSADLGAAQRKEASATERMRKVETTKAQAAERKAAGAKELKAIEAENRKDLAPVLDEAGVKYDDLSEMQRAKVGVLKARVEKKTLSKKRAAEMLREDGDDRMAAIARVIERPAPRKVAARKVAKAAPEAPAKAASAKKAAPEGNVQEQLRQKEAERLRAEIKDAIRSRSNVKRRQLQDRLQGVENAGHAEDIAPEEMTPDGKRAWADSYRQSIRDGFGDEVAQREANIDAFKAAQAARAGAPEAPAAAKKAARKVAKAAPEAAPETEAVPKLTPAQRAVAQAVADGTTGNTIRADVNKRLQDAGIIEWEKGKPRLTDVGKKALAQAAGRPTVKRAAKAVVPEAPPAKKVAGRAAKAAPEAPGPGLLQRVAADLRADQLAREQQRGIMEREQSNIRIQNAVTHSKRGLPVGSRGLHPYQALRDGDIERLSKTEIEGMTKDLVERRDAAPDLSRKRAVLKQLDRLHGGHWEPPGEAPAPTKAAKKVAKATPEAPPTKKVAKAAPDGEVQERLRQNEAERVRAQIKGERDAAERRRLQDRLQGLENAGHAEDIAPDEFTPDGKSAWADAYRRSIRDGSGDKVARREADTDMFKATQVAPTSAPETAPGRPRVTRAAKKVVPTPVGEESKLTGKLKGLGGDRDKIQAELDKDENGLDALREVAQDLKLDYVQPKPELKRSILEALSGKRAPRKVARAPKTSPLPAHEPAAPAKAARAAPNVPENMKDRVRPGGMIGLAHIQKGDRVMVGQRDGKWYPSDRITDTPITVDRQEIVQLRTRTGGVANRRILIGHDDQGNEIRVTGPQDAGHTGTQTFRAARPEGAKVAKAAKAAPDVQERRSQAIKKALQSLRSADTNDADTRYQDFIQRRIDEGIAPAVAARYMRQNADSYERAAGERPHMAYGYDLHKPGEKEKILRQAAKWRKAADDFEAENKTIRPSKVAKAVPEAAPARPKVTRAAAKKVTVPEAAPEVKLDRFEQERFDSLSPVAQHRYRELREGPRKANHAEALALAGNLDRPASRKTRVNEYNGLTREQFDALPADRKKLILDDLKSISESGDKRTIPSNRTSMGTTIRGAEATHVTQARSLRDRFTRTPGPTKAAKPGAAPVLARLDDKANPPDGLDVQNMLTGMDRENVTAVAERVGVENPKGYTLAGLRREIRFKVDENNRNAPKAPETPAPAKAARAVKKAVPEAAPETPAPRAPRKVAAPRPRASAEALREKVGQNRADLEGRLSTDQKKELDGLSPRQRARYWVRRVESGDDHNSALSKATGGAAPAAARPVVKRATAPRKVAAKAAAPEAPAKRMTREQMMGEIDRRRLAGEDLHAYDRTFTRDELERVLNGESVELRGSQRRKAAKARAAERAAEVAAAPVTPRKRPASGREIIDQLQAAKTDEEAARIVRPIRSRQRLDGALRTVGSPPSTEKEGLAGGKARLLESMRPGVSAPERPVVKRAAKKVAPEAPAARKIVKAAPSGGYKAVTQTGLPRRKSNDLKAKEWGADQGYKGATGGWLSKGGKKTDIQGWDSLYKRHGKEIEDWHKKNVIEDRETLGLGEGLPLAEAQDWARSNESLTNLRKRLRERQASKTARVAKKAAPEAAPERPVVKRAAPRKVAAKAAPEAVPQAEAAARSKGEVFDKARSDAHIVATLDQAIANEGSDRSILHSIDNATKAIPMAGTRGISTKDRDALKRAFDTKGREGLKRALASYERRHGLTRIGNTGEVVPFDPERHRVSGNLHAKPGEPVLVLAPGHEVHAPGDEKPSVANYARVMPASKTRKAAKAVTPEAPAKATRPRVTRAAKKAVPKTSPLQAHDQTPEPPDVSEIPRAPKRARKAAVRISAAIKAEPVPEGADVREYQRARARGFSKKTAGEWARGIAKAREGLAQQREAEREAKAAQIIKKTPPKVHGEEPDFFPRKVAEAPKTAEAPKKAERPTVRRVAKKVAAAVAQPFRRQTTEKVKQPEAHKPVAPKLFRDTLTPAQLRDWESLGSNEERAQYQRLTKRGMSHEAAMEAAPRLVREEHARSLEREKARRRPRKVAQKVVPEAGAPERPKVTRAGAKVESADDVIANRGTIVRPSEHPGWDIVQHDGNKRWYILDPDGKLHKDGRISSSSSLENAQKRLARVAGPPKAAPAKRVAKKAAPEAPQPDRVIRDSRRTPAGQRAAARKAAETAEAAAPERPVVKRAAEKAAPEVAPKAPAKRTPRKVAAKAAPTVTKETPAELAKRLRTMKSADEATEAMAGMKKAELLEVAREAGVTSVTPRDTNDRLIQQIAFHGVQRRLNSDAIYKAVMEPKPWRPAAKAAPEVAAPERPVVKRATKATPESKELKPLANGTRRKSMTNVQEGDVVRGASGARGGSEVPRRVTKVERDGNSITITRDDGSTLKGNANTAVWLGEAPKAEAPAAKRGAKKAAPSAPEAPAKATRPRVTRAAKAVPEPEAKPTPKSVANDPVKLRRHAATTRQLGEMRMANNPPGSAHYKRGQQDLVDANRMDQEADALEKAATPAKKAAAKRVPAKKTAPEAPEAPAKATRPRVTRAAAKKAAPEAAAPEAPAKAARPAAKRTTKRALPSGRDIEAVDDVKKLSNLQIMQGDHLTPSGRKALNDLGPEGHPRLAAIPDTEDKIREAYRMLSSPGGSSDSYVAIADVRKLIGNQASREDVDATFKGMIHKPDVRLTPQHYGRSNAATRIPAAVKIGGQDNDMLHIDDPDLARPSAFGAVHLATELSNRRAGRPGDPMLSKISDAELRKEVSARVAGDPITARDVANYAPDWNGPRARKSVKKTGADLVGTPEPEHAGVPDTDTRVAKAKKRLQAREALHRRSTADGSGELADMLNQVIEARQGNDDPAAFRRAVRQRLLSTPGEKTDPKTQGYDDLRKALTGESFTNPEELGTRLRQELAKRGITMTSTPGAETRFNPDLHRSVGGDIPDNADVQVIRPGLIFTDKDGTVVTLQKPVVKRVTTSPVGSVHPRTKTGKFRDDRSAITKTLDRAVDRIFGPPTRPTVKRAGTKATAPSHRSTQRPLTGKASLLTADLFERDTDPRGVPVRDFTPLLGGGYTIKNGTAWRRNGVTYVVEHDETGEGKRRAIEAARVLEHHHSTLPAGARQYQKSYVWNSGSNPEDPEFAKKHGVDKFTSAMTAGGGETHIWQPGIKMTPEGRVDAKQLLSDLNHEYGHNADISGISETTGWHDAGASADPSRYIDPKTWVPLRSGRAKKIALKPQPKERYPYGVTPYGASSDVEDFAESVDLYLQGRIGAGQLLDQPGLSWLWFRDLFPERAAILDRLFPEVARQQRDEIAKLESSPTRRRVPTRTRAS